MCIVAFAWHVLEDMPLCLLSNRDEFYHRPSAMLHSWEHSSIIAGKDLQSGGTWMGVTASGRWAIVTNYLFVGDREQAVYMSNRGEAPQVLANGVYVVSNGLMSEDWEKTKHLRKRFTQEFLPMLQQTQIPEHDLNYAAWDILEDERKIIPDLLPDTGISKEMEELLSSTFIQSPIYGTRCSNFLRMTTDQWQWIEKTQQGEQQGKFIELTIPLVK